MEPPLLTDSNKISKGNKENKKLGLIIFSARKLAIIGAELFFNFQRPVYAWNLLMLSIL